MPLLTPHVPGGLIQLMKALAKEVLRDKPENIYEFAAVHFEKLIQQRDGSLDKGYEQFVAFDALFDGQQRFAIPANCGFTCCRPVKMQPNLQPRKSKSDMMTGFKAMESINEEDIPTENLYTDEKYQKAIYVIQRYYRRYAAKKKGNPSTTTPLTATTAAIIIQRTMRRLFANKIKLKTAGDDTTAKRDGVVQDDVDNVSEAASYTSSSTIQMLADSQEGRENRLPGREEVSDGGGGGGGGDDVSTEFKEQTQDEPPVAKEKNSDVAATEMNRKSIADENGNSESTSQDETPTEHPTTALDDTSTAHIGILSTIIGNNDQQNSLYTNTVEVNSNSSDPTQIKQTIPNIVAVGDFPLNFPQSLGASPNTFPPTSPQSEIQETFAIRLHDNIYAEDNTTYPFQSDAQVRKFDPDTRESLKIYDVFYQDRDDPDFSDSLNESTMERDSLENEDLDVDSLESNENVPQNVYGIMKKEVRQDDGSLYEDTDEVQEEENVHDVQRLIELERVPSYIYGIHPPRTPVAEKKNVRNKNSAESRKMRDTKDLSFGMDDRTPEEKLEEVSLESKESTSEESSVTQIENVLEYSEEQENGNDEDDFKDHQASEIQEQEPIETKSDTSFEELKTDGKLELSHNGILLKEQQSRDTSDNEPKFGPGFDLGSIVTSKYAPQVEEFIQMESKAVGQKETSDEARHKPENFEAQQPIIHITSSEQSSLDLGKVDRNNLSASKEIISPKYENPSVEPEFPDPERSEKLHIPLKVVQTVPGSEHDSVSIDLEPTLLTDSTNQEGMSNDGALWTAEVASFSTSSYKNENEEQGLKTEESKGEFSTKDSLESDKLDSTQRTQEFAQKPKEESRRIESVPEGGDKSPKDVLLDGIETSHEHAEPTTHRQKRSLDVNVVPQFSENEDKLKIIDSTIKQIPSVTEGLVETLDEKLNAQLGPDKDRTSENEKVTEANPKESETKSEQTESDQSKSIEDASSGEPSVKKSKEISNTLLIEGLIPHPSAPLGYFATLYSGQNLSRPTSSLSGHPDSEVESQLRELQSLNNLYPGLEIRDIISEFHTKDIQPEERRNDKDQAHDANNNVEGFEMSTGDQSDSEVLAFSQDREQNDKGDSEGDAKEELLKNIPDEGTQKLILDKESKVTIEVKEPSKEINMKLGSEDKNGNKEYIKVVVKPPSSTVFEIPKETTVKSGMMKSEGVNNDKDEVKDVVPPESYSALDITVNEKTMEHPHNHRDVADLQTPKRSKRSLEPEKDEVIDDVKHDFNLESRTTESHESSSISELPSEATLADVVEESQMRLETEDKKVKDDLIQETNFKTSGLLIDITQDHEPNKEVVKEIREKVETLTCAPSTSQLTSHNPESIYGDEEKETSKMEVNKPKIVKESTTSTVKTGPEDERKLQGEDYFGNTIDEIQPIDTDVIKILKIDGLGRATSISRLDSKDKLPKVEEETRDSGDVTGEVESSDTETKHLADESLELYEQLQKEQDTENGKSALTEIGQEKTSNLKVSETLAKEQSEISKHNVIKMTTLTDDSTVKKRTDFDEAVNGKNDDGDNDKLIRKIVKSDSSEALKHKSTSEVEKRYDTNSVITSKSDDPDKELNDSSSVKQENVEPSELEKEKNKNRSKSDDPDKDLDDSSSVKEEIVEPSELEKEKNKNPSDIDTPKELEYIIQRQKSPEVVKKDVDSTEVISKSDISIVNLNEYDNSFDKVEKLELSGTEKAKIQYISELKTTNEKKEFSDLEKVNNMPTSDMHTSEKLETITKSPQVLDASIDLKTSTNLLGMPKANEINVLESKSIVSDEKDFEAGTLLRPSSIGNLTADGESKVQPSPSEGLEPSAKNGVSENETKPRPEVSEPNQEKQLSDRTLSKVIEPVSGEILKKDKPTYEPLISGANSGPDHIEAKLSEVLKVNILDAGSVEEKPDIKALVTGSSVSSDRIKDFQLSDVAEVKAPEVDPISDKPDVEAQLTGGIVSLDHVEDEQFNRALEVKVSDASQLKATGSGLETLLPIVNVSPDNFEIQVSAASPGLKTLVAEANVISDSTGADLEDLFPIANVSPNHLEIKISDASLLKTKPGLRTLVPEADVIPDATGADLEDLIPIVNVSSDHLEVKLSEPNLLNEKPGIETSVLEANASLTPIEADQITAEYPVLEVEIPEQSIIKEKSSSETLVAIERASPDRAEDKQLSEMKSPQADLVDKPGLGAEVLGKNIPSDDIQEREVGVLSLAKDKLDLGAEISGEKVESEDMHTSEAELIKAKADHTETDQLSTETPLHDEHALELRISDETLIKDNLKTKPDEANRLDSVASSASLPTEVTSCDESNAETSADFSSIGKDLEFFEDTINYLKSATTLLGTMDDAFDDDKKKVLPQPIVVVHLAEDLPDKDENHNQEPKDLKKDDQSNKISGDVLNQAAVEIQREFDRKVNESEVNSESPVADEEIKREKLSLVSEAPISGDVLNQTAVVIQSGDVLSQAAVAIQRDFDRKVNESEVSSESPVADEEIKREKRSLVFEAPISGDVVNQTAVVIQSEDILSQAAVGIQREFDKKVNESEVSSESPVADEEIKREKRSLVSEAPTSGDVLNQAAVVIPSGDILSQAAVEIQSEFDRKVNESEVSSESPVADEEIKREKRSLVSEAPTSGDVLNQAAVVIQSAVRGYQVRKTLSTDVKQTGLEVNKEIIPKITLDNIEEAIHKSALKDVKTADFENNQTSVAIIHPTKYLSHPTVVVHLAEDHPEEDVEPEKEDQSNETNKDNVVGQKAVNSEIESSSTTQNGIIDEAQVVKQVIRPSTLPSRITREKPLERKPRSVKDDGLNQVLDETIRSVEKPMERKINIVKSISLDDTRQAKTFITDVTKSKPVKSDSYERKTSITREKPIEIRGKAVKIDSFDKTRKDPIKHTSSGMTTQEKKKYIVKPLERDGQTGKDENKSKTLRSKVSSTADLVHRPRLAKSKRQQFGKKGRSMSMNEETQKQSSFDLEAIKKELLSKKIKISTQSVKKTKMAAKEDRSVKIRDKGQISLSKDCKNSHISKESSSDSAKKSSSETSGHSEADPTCKSIEKGPTKFLNPDEPSDGIKISPESPNDKAKTSGEKLVTVDRSTKSACETSPIFDSLKEEVDKLKDTVLQKSATTIQKTFRGYKTRKNLRSSEIRSPKQIVEVKEIVSSDPKMTDRISDTYENGRALDYASTSQKEQKVAPEEEALLELVRDYSQQRDPKAKQEEEEEATDTLDIFDNLKRDFTDFKNSALDKSATTIQKTYRGYRTRKDLRAAEEISDTDHTVITEASKTERDNILDGLTKTRKTLAKEKISKESEDLDMIDRNKSEEDTGKIGVIDSFDVEEFQNDALQKSATTIQKTFRGYKTRKELTKEGVKEDKLRGKKEESDNIFNNADEVIQKSYENSKTLDNKQTDTPKRQSSKSNEAGGEDINQKQADDEGHHKVSSGDDVKSSEVLENAAVTIQKTYKGYKTRKELLHQLEDDGQQDKRMNESDEQNDQKQSIGKESADKRSEGVEVKSDVYEADPKYSKTLEEIHLIQNKYDRTGDNVMEKAYKDNNKIRPTSEHKTDIMAKNILEANQSREDIAHDVKINSTDTQSFKAIKPNEDDSAIITQTEFSDNQKPEDIRTARSSIARSTIKSTSAGALLEKAASTIQKAYRDYHTRNDSISTKPSKSYSHGAHRENALKEAVENSDESSTFIGPDTSFDLSDFESEKQVSNREGHNSTDTPTLIHDDDKYDEVDLETSISPTFDVKILPKGQQHENDSTITRPTSGNSLFAPQEIRRKRSIIEATAPPLEDILNADTTTSNDQKPQWYVGDDLIVPTDDTNLSTEPSSFLNPLASSSSFEKLSSIDARNENLNSNLQLTPSINSAVVSTSSLLFANDTEMHNKNPLNKHSRAVSANKEEEEDRLEETIYKEDFVEERKFEEGDRIEEKIKSENLEKGVSQDHEAAEDVSNGLATRKETSYLYSIDPFAPRSGREDDKEKEIDDSQMIVTDLCKDCADGIHEAGATIALDGQKSTEAELSKETPIQVANVEDTKDKSDSPEKHFDEIKQFVLMEELSPTVSDSTNKETEKVNGTNGNKNKDDTEMSALEKTHKEQSADSFEKTFDNQMTSEGELESSVVVVKVIDQDSKEIQHEDIVRSKYPSISLIPPSSEDDTSDRESIHETEIPDSKKVSADDENDRGVGGETLKDHKGELESKTDKLDESPSSGEDYNEGEKTRFNGKITHNKRDGEIESVDISEESATVKSDVGEIVELLDPKTEELVSIKIVKDHQGDNDYKNKDETTVSGGSNDVQIEEKSPKENVGDSEPIVGEETIEDEQKVSQTALPDQKTEEESVTKSDEIRKSPMTESHDSESPEPDALKTEEKTVNKDQRFEDDFNENAEIGTDDKPVVEDLITPTKQKRLSSEQSVVKSGDHSQSINSETLPNGKDTGKENEIKDGGLKDLKLEGNSKEGNETIDQLLKDIKPSNKPMSTKPTEGEGDNNSKDLVSKSIDDGPVDEQKTVDKSTSEDIITLNNETKEPSKDDVTDQVDKSSKELEPQPIDGETEVVNEIMQRTPSEDTVSLNEDGTNLEALEGTRQVDKNDSKDVDNKLTEDDGEVRPEYEYKDLAFKTTEDLRDKSLEKSAEELTEKPISKFSKVDKVTLKPEKKILDQDNIRESPDDVRGKESGEDSQSLKENIKTISKEGDVPLLEDLEIASKLLETSLGLDDKETTQALSDVKLVSDEEKVSSEAGNNLDQSGTSEKSTELTKSIPSLQIASSKDGSGLGGASEKSQEHLESKPSSEENGKIGSTEGEPSENPKSPSKLDLVVQAKLEKLMVGDELPIESDANCVDRQDLPTENAPEEVIEITCIKKVIPPTPLSVASDQDESELESTTTKADSTTTTPAYDDASENETIEIPPSIPDNLEAMTEKLRETEAMVARMHQRRASEHKISIESVDQPPAFDEPICEPIKPMQELQKSSSIEVEDDIILQKLQRGDTTRESSAQSESIIFGDSASQVAESDDTFNENLDPKTLHRMNTIAAERSTYKPPGLLFKSVTIDDTIKYIDPEKSTEESGGSFCMDDATSADVRKKIMAYSVSEADSDYYDAGEQTSRPHDDFNISTALDTFPSSDTDTTIVSAATKIQAGARGFLTRRRLRRASMGTKSSLTEEIKTSFGNDAIGESLDRLVEEEVGKRIPKVQYHRQVGVNSLPSGLMGNSDETKTVHLSPTHEEIHADDDSVDLKLTKVTTTTLPHGEWSSIDGQGDIHPLSTSSGNDVNSGIAEEDDSAQVPSNLEATLAARRLTLQRGDAMRNDSTPDDDNGNGKQVDPAKNIPATTGTMLIHEKTMVESTTTTKTTTTTERRNYSDAAMTVKMEKVKWFGIRQNSMPVQIDSDVFRVLPKHMRKRIKSAEGEKKKRIRLPRD